MSDQQSKVNEIAAELLSCERERRERVPFTAENWPDLTMADGFEVQDATLKHREARGEKLVGVKMGLTSKAKQRTMNVDVPGMGWVTDAMQRPLGSPVPLDDYIHPRIEPEIFFRLKHDLVGPGITAAAAAAAVATVSAGADVIDSRYTAFKFTLADVLADNASSAEFIEGPRFVALDEVDLELEAVLVEVDGEVVDSATASAILGHPLESLATAANMLGERGHGLRAGDVVLAGAMTDAVPLERGKHIAFHFSTLGSIHITVK